MIGCSSKSMLYDLRAAFRQLRRSPGFLIAAILTLALGIGATVSMFSLVNAVLRRPLPFPEPDQLTWIAYDDTAIGGNQTNTFSYPNFFDLRDQNHTFRAMASYRNTNATLTGVGEARQISGEIVSADFFRVLGVAPMAGRDFSRDDEKATANMVMLSWPLWQHTLGGRPEMVGSVIRLDGKQYMVAGIMPPEFSFPVKTPPAEMWTTLADDASEAVGLASQRGAGVLNLVGRLKPGVSIAEARADLAVLAANLASRYPGDNAQLTRMMIDAELDHLVEASRPALRLLFAAVTLVLFIGCVNVAGLLLARMSRRRPEFALLAALGAGRGEIVRRVLVESVMVSVTGGALGVLIAAWGTDAMLGLLPASLPRITSVTLDPTVLGFAAVVSLLTGVLFGVLPAWRISRIDPIVALREGARGVTGGRGQFLLQNALVICETALGLVLLIGSGLLARSFVRVLNLQPGFDPHHVLTARLSVPEPRFNRDQRIAFYEDVAAKLRTLPRVESVAAGFPLPLSGNDIHVSFDVEGRPNAKGSEPSAYMAVVTADFFHTLRIPLMAGREFTAADQTTSPAVMIVNDAFARKYFPGESALGKRVKPGLGDGVVEAPMREIVGVVGDVKRAGLTAAMEPQYYLPWKQAVITFPFIAIRTAIDPSSLVSPLRATVARMDPEVPVFRAITLDESVYQAASEPRFRTMLLTSFAAMALLLTSIGLYAVLSYTVSQRSAEISVRMALGASRGGILSMILGRGLALSAAGIAIGLAASFALTRQLAGMLYGIEPFDPVTFISVSAMLLSISIGASVAPAFRAANVDPMRVLREQ
jgi:putative ABC transport system permease protein